MVTVTKIDSVQPYKKGTKVVAARDLDGVPEGCPGKVKLINGTVWARYWVEFDNGVWLGSIDHASLVPAREWEAYKRRRAEQAEQAATAGDEAAAPSGDEASAGAPAGGDDTASKIPAHLLERSRKARERAQAQSAG